MGLTFTSTEADSKAFVSTFVNLATGEVRPHEPGTLRRLDQIFETYLFSFPPPIGTNIYVTSDSIDDEYRFVKPGTISYYDKDGTLTERYQVPAGVRSIYNISIAPNKRFATMLSDIARTGYSYLIVPAFDSSPPVGFFQDPMVIYTDMTWSLDSRLIALIYNNSHILTIQIYGIDGKLRWQMVGNDPIDLSSFDVRACDLNAQAQ